jgi:hypothetical protein
MNTTRDPHQLSRSLVDLAVASDDSRRLIETAGAELGHPLGLVDAGGAVVAAAPDDDRGQRALAVAGAAARNRVVAPPGWRVFSLVQQSCRLGFLAVGTQGPGDAETLGALHLLPLLLADQLRRAMLVRLHALAFVRRLVSDPPLGAHSARREAAEVGLALAEAYWPAILDWRAGAARADVLEGLGREARGLAWGSLTTPLNGHLVLLHPASGGADDDPTTWLERVALRARTLAPSAQARIIAAERPVEPAHLSEHVARLEEICRFGPRAAGDRALTWAPQYALDGLLYRHVQPAVAARFVDEHVGRLIEWDREHQTDLVRTLEAALDFPRHDQAADMCFMHRNTFRHHLSQATEVVGERLEDPDVRLCVHLALKLSHLVQADRAGGPDGEPRRRRALRSRGTGRG